MLPEDWSIQTIGELCDFINGHGFKAAEWSDSGLPIIRIQNLNGSKDFNYYSGEPKPEWMVYPGDLLFAWAGTKGVSFGPRIWHGPKGVLNQHIYKVKIKPGVDRGWFYEILQRVTERIEKSAHGFKGTLLHVKKSDIINQPVPVPKKSEQENIASILSAWNQAIEITERLTENSKARKKAIMQALMRGNRRIPGLQGKWQFQKICEIADRVQRKSETKDLPILTISSTSGFLRQDEKYRRYMAGKSVDDYILLDRGEFAYNKGNSKTYQFGCVFPLEEYERALVPHVYVCFKLKQAYHAGFYKYLFESDYLRPQIGALVNTGVRNNGLLNIRPAEFMATKVPVPPYDEQERVARIVEVASKELANRSESVEKLRLQKKALMQQLLTGKRRVNLDSAA